MSQSDEAIAILNDITGSSTLSDEYVDVLNTLHISESDGYIIKLKINNEILSDKLKPDEVQPRLERLLDNLAQTRIHDGHVDTYSNDLILFLYNQDDELTCDNCGSRILAIDSYCSKCGCEYVPNISPFDLMTSISSEHITPGDVIRINKDNTVEISSIDEEHSKKDEVVDYNEIEQSYENNMVINKLNIIYFKTILLDYIYKYGNLSKLDNELPISYNITNTSLVLKQLINDNLMEVNDTNTYYNNIINNSDDLSLIPMDVWIQIKLSVTHKGVDYLNSNNHVFYYDYYVKDSLVDDIIKFDEIYRTSDNKDLDTSFIKYIDTKKKEFLDNEMFDEYIATFTLEAFFYEVTENTKQQIIALLEKYIAILNLSTNDKNNSFDAIDSESMDLIGTVLKNNNIEFDVLKKYFRDAYEEFDSDNFIFSYDEAFNYLLLCINGEDVSRISSQIKEYRQKKG